jgi:hypothetical protein
LPWHQEKPKRPPYEDETTSRYEEILTHRVTNTDKPEPKKNIITPLLKANAAKHENRLALQVAKWALSAQPFAGFPWKG